jgi:hypothetical protein
MGSRPTESRSHTRVVCPDPSSLLLDILQSVFNNVSVGIVTVPTNLVQVGETLSEGPDGLEPSTSPLSDVRPHPDGDDHE